MLRTKNIFPLLLIVLITIVINSCQKDYTNPNLAGDGTSTIPPDSVFITSITMSGFPELNDVTGLPYDSDIAVDTNSTDTIYADPFFKIEDADNFSPLYEFTQPSYYLDVKNTDAVTYYFTTPYACSGFGKHLHLTFQDFDSTNFSGTNPVNYSELIDTLFVTLPVPVIGGELHPPLPEFTTPKGIKVGIGLLYK